MWRRLATAGCHAHSVAWVVTLRCLSEKRGWSQPLVTRTNLLSGRFAGFDGINGRSAGDRYNRHKRSVTSGPPRFLAATSPNGERSLGQGQYLCGLLPRDMPALDDA